MKNYCQEHTRKEEGIVASGSTAQKSHPYKRAKYFVQCPTVIHGMVPADKREEPLTSVAGFQETLTFQKIWERVISMMARWNEKYKTGKVIVVIGLGRQDSNHRTIF